jgi:hypothetical protein
VGVSGSEGYVDEVDETVEDLGKVSLFVALGDLVKFLLKKLETKIL